MDTVSSDLISKMLATIASLTAAEVKTIRTAKVELQHFKAQLERIKSVLIKVESLPFFKQKEVKRWMIELKGVIYDAQDMIEEYRDRMEVLRAKGASSTGHTLSRKKVRLAITRPLTSFKKHLLYPFKLGHNIKNIQQQLSRFIDDLESEDKLKSLLRESNQHAPDISSAIPDRATTSSLDKEEEVGREDDKMVLKQQLLQEKEDAYNKRSYSIVAIVGKGGLGKTFLAQMIFNDEQVKQEFGECVWWVCVSEKPDQTNMAKKLLEAVLKRNASHEGNDLETLCGKLGEKIKDKKFLLVLDDVWDLKWWERLKFPLRKGAHGSKILITMRNRGLKEELERDVPVFVHDLPVLTAKESWKLFTKQLGKTDAELKKEDKLEIGERILQKCGALPLVIKTVGSLLRLKDSRTQWENVEKSPIWRWKGENDADGGLLPGLVLSYDDLRPHLKDCFVYCCLFPKDYKIEKRMLKQQWIANGLVEEKEEIDMEERANDCVNELVSRCLLEDSHADITSGFLRMHDIIHDLALYIGGEEYSHGRVKENTHHLSLMGTHDNPFSQEGCISHSTKLRTLLCPEALALDFSLNFVSNLKGLRVLQYYGGIKSQYHWIRECLHLRYLHLRRCNLLKSIDILYNLVHLRTLEIIECPKIKWLPSLPHIVYMKLMMLHSLKGWLSRDDGKAVILPSLMKLEMSKCPKIKWLPCFPKVEDMMLKECISLKGWLSSEDGKTVILPSLMRLEIEFCEHIKWLPRLPKVKVMKLRNLHSLKGWLGSEDSKAVIFSSLTTLDIYYCPNIKWLPRLPKVENMQLSRCKSLEGWSRSEEEVMPSLTKIEVWCCPNLKVPPHLAGLLHEHESINDAEIVLIDGGLGGIFLVVDQRHG